jgi:acyl-coenzyme A thioesterase PaaI-like protein
VSASELESEFYGFPEIPFHIHLGMRFHRSEDDGQVVVTIPASPAFTHPGGAHSLCAVYTVAEVSSGLAMCDGLSLRALTEEVGDMRPLALTRECSFHPGDPARGEIHSQTWFASDPEESLERLRRRNKVTVRAGARVLAADGTVAGQMDATFYVRLMALEHLEAMAGTLTPTIAGAARG